MLASRAAIVDGAEYGPVMTSPCDDRRDCRAMTLLSYVTASEEGPGADNDDMDVRIGMPTDATKVAGVSRARCFYPRCDVDASRDEASHQIVGATMIADDRHAKIAGFGGYARFI